MGLGKQAKVLSNQQIKLVLKYFDEGRNNERNRVIFLLSVTCGLRAKEIADLELSMVLNAEGKVGDLINLQDKASKGRSGRVLPMKSVLQDAINDYLKVRKHSESPYLVTSERSEKFSPNAIAVFFKRLYDKLGFVGASSHSGRRTFITSCAKKVSLAGGSIKDLCQLSGHRNVENLKRYIDTDTEAQRKLVDMIYSI